MGSIKLTSWYGIFLEKFIVARMVKKFLAFKPKILITVFTKDHHWTPSYVS